MADIYDIFGAGGFTGQGIDPLPPEPIEEQFKDAIDMAGIRSPRRLLIDGKIHRFNTGGRFPKDTSDRSGWYLAFDDGIPSITFGDWKTGFVQTFRANTGRTTPWSIEEEREYKERTQRAIEQRDAERKIKQEKAIEEVEIIWEMGATTTDEHPYLARKGIQPHGAVVVGDGRLAIPMFDKEGKLSTLQYIAADGRKMFHAGISTAGKFCSIGKHTGGVLYIAEGFATAATIHEQTGKACIASFSAAQLVPVTEIMREKYGVTQEIVIIADNDESGVGLKYAEQAAEKYGARVIMPPEKGDANDYHLAGHSLTALLNPAPVNDDWLVKADDFCQQPAPVKWLIRNWVQENALVMVHGMSGGGKTFVVLDWCLRIASGLQEWCGNPVKSGNVVYLAGEGHHGLKGRIAAWKHANSQSNLNMWLSKSGCDLNTADGYKKVVESIRQIPEKPCLIVVDTLHRFLNGDENKATDTKVMLDACAGLIREFGASVILVHHTGVSEESQGRARGSSAWKGALENEISIIPAKDGQPMQILQKKAKDSELAEPVYATLETVSIPNWFDEYGEQCTSVVVVQADEPEKAVEKPESKTVIHLNTFERAWWKGEAELQDGKPYVSRSVLKEMLLQDGRTKRTVENDLCPSYENTIIGYLINAEIIKPHLHGWIMTNEFYAGSLILKKER